jgi:hypothetical protein
MGGWEVRPADPGRTRRQILRWLLVLAAIPLAFYAGRYWPVADGWLHEPAPVQEVARIAELEQQLEQAQQRLALLSSGEKVSQQANEQSRLTIKLLEEQIYKQQQDLAFYKGVLAPASRREGLRVRTFEVQATDRPGVFRYKILLSRVGKGDTPLAGQLQVTLLGQQGDAEQSLELAPLTQGLADALAEQSIPFAFKHFQAIPEAGRFAELQLPEGFVPREIRVRALVEGEKPLLRTFKWNNQEKSDGVE